MKEEMLGLSIELIKIIISSMLGASIIYWFSIKGKKQDVDFQKNKELNIVLSNMLDTWHYLNKINELLKFQEDSNTDSIYPMKYLPLIVLKSGNLNDSCFGELEKSIVTLKQYDPLAYHNLEGIGRKFGHIKSNFILPFLTTKYKHNNVSKIISRTFLDNLLKDIEEHLTETAKLISRETLHKIEKKIEINFEKDFDKVKEDLNNWFYDFVCLALPEGHKMPTKEELKAEMNNQEVQDQMLTHFESIANSNITLLCHVVTENPAISIEELAHTIENHSSEN